MSTGREPTLDLDALESDLAPLFVIRVGSEQIPFEILFSNAAFRSRDFGAVVLAKGRNALLFRSWAQAVGPFDRTHDLGGYIWTAELAGKERSWKAVRVEQDHEAHGEEKQSASKPKAPGQQPQFGGTDAIAQLQSIRTMMEMSDVGVFEFDPSGRLISANKAWYRLSSHPEGPEGLADQFSFMDIIHPEDLALVMSAWNTLAQGSPVTFEMRWKPREDSTDVVGWVLSACVPVFDEDGKLIRIAGNIIDISAQKQSEKAAVSRLEALEQVRLSELRFARFTELAPIAIYIYTPHKGINYVNNQFYELTGHPRGGSKPPQWSHIVSQKDIESWEQEWFGPAERNKVKHLQFRLKKTWTDQEGFCSEIWVEGSSCPELDDEGNTISIMGTLFDISRFKWAESVQRRRVEEALESKRQKEDFIDMTSHELRNPLSAVVQCADSVIATLRQLSLHQYTAMHPALDAAAKEIDVCIESLGTIVSCSLHQKRIIDDVLILSKLDSNLLLITPIRVQPANVVSEVLRMFDLECNGLKISLEFKEDDSLRGFEWVMLDPSRLVQVLLNLVTNAIKFTKDRPTRRITVTVGGSRERLPRSWNSVTFTSSDTTAEDSTKTIDLPEWGEGKKAFLWLTVQDTGCGMSLAEQKKLFARFSQTTPRTHIKYGGSGLGLFISKSLAALQGGSIGVHSNANVGSTFAFFVATRIAQAPAHLTGSFLRPPLDSIEEAMKEARLNILIVEDNIINQKVLARQLEKLGCVVHVAGNGVEALEWLRGSIYWQGHTSNEDDTDTDTATYDPRTTAKPRSSTNPTKPHLDIILLDIEMPIMNGLSCARLIRDYEQQGLLAAPASPQADSRARRPSASEAQPTLRLPILAVSANARSEQMKSAVDAGMDDAITKPFRVRELWVKMAGLVGRVG
ncbi:hypothetical protein BDV95DRAFT_676451 [Massariosphaeria phaeospora]|uniref:histidine kinase n=1 Tax=Massariosphaeria phaeospora TaxID=100035 RepID=A0A7C8MA14_9PLEO|nr:hypothetical protein BDV95DRAFT_676451 [Massariosphaeria phaeospora]